MAHKVDLEHLKGEVPKEDLSRIRSKYRSLPDLYWQDNVDAVITPDRFDSIDEYVVQKPGKSQLAVLWELCSGSGALSARARDQGVSHLPMVHGTAT